MQNEATGKLQEARMPRWWFGSVASPLSILVSHPMDVVKVAYQTSERSTKVMPIIRQIRFYSGLGGFYDGCVASMTRQFLSNGSRTALYYLCVPYVQMESFISKVILAGFAGLLGSFVGFPADVINIRQQSDLKFPPEKRRKYGNIVQAMRYVYKNEGLKNLYTGCSLTMARGMLVSMTSLAFYEHCKQMLINEGYIETSLLHLYCSVASSIVSCTLCQPLDIVKSKVIASANGTYQNGWRVFKNIKAEGGMRIFCRGYWLNFSRVCPHTVATFMIMEQLRKHFGYLPQQNE